MNGSADLNDIIGKLTENPEIMKNLMDVAGGLMNGERGSANDGYSYREKENSFREERFERDFSDDERTRRAPDRRKKGDDAGNLIRLLTALKPYVSRERGEKIDSIVKILKLVQLSEKSGLLNSLL